MYPKELVYSKEHEWALQEGEVVTIGVTHFAQDELGEVVFVELPEVGSSFAAHGEIGTIESVKAVAEVYTPISGEVVAVNEALQEAPELVNEDPHGKGWLIKVKPGDASELGAMMSSEDYAAFTENGG